MPAHQLDLFATGQPRLTAGAPTHRHRLDDGSWVDVTRGALAGGDALVDELIRIVPWRQGRRQMYGRPVDDPRLSRWYRADDPPVHPILDEARAELARRYGVTFGGVGLNWYRDGRDSVAPHADRELRRLEDTLVAILTVGARRPFLLRPRQGGRAVDLAPASGDLLVMGGRCQLDWHHAVPKVARAGPRISLSWRWSSDQPEGRARTQLLRAP